MSEKKKSVVISPTKTYFRLHKLFKFIISIILKASIFIHFNRLTPELIINQKREKKSNLILVLLLIQTNYKWERTRKPIRENNGLFGSNGYEWFHVLKSNKWYFVIFNHRDARRWRKTQVVRMKNPTFRHYHQTATRNQSQNHNLQLKSCEVQNMTYWYTEQDVQSSH